MDGTVVGLALAVLDEDMTKQEKFENLKYLGMSTRVENERQMLEGSSSTKTTTTRSPTSHAAAANANNNNNSSQSSKQSPVNRAKKCPMLVRIFCRNGGHHRLNDFTSVIPTSSSGLPVDDELTIYTW